MCDPILVTSENVNPLHYSQFNHANVTPSSGTFPLASYKEVAPLPPSGVVQWREHLPPTSVARNQRRNLIQVTCSADMPLANACET